MTKKKIDKAEQLDNLASKGEVYCKLLKLIFNKKVRFFIDISKIKIDKIKTFCMKDEVELDEELYELLYKLSSGEFRGNDGIQKCSDFINQLDYDEEIEMFKNILDNKLRLGIGVTDINKLCNNLNIYQYEVMFAKRMDHVNNIDWRKKHYIQPKIDGMRCVDEKEEYKNSFLTRTGEPITSVDFLADQFNHNWKGLTIVCDGEIESGACLEETGALRRKSEQVEDAIYTLFGIYDLEQWRTRKHTDNYEEVYFRTKRMLEDHPIPNVRLIPSYEIQANSEDEFYEIVMRYFQSFLDQGYEGAVLKTADHVYQPSAGTRRSNDWIKIKPQESTEGRIVDILEGTGEHVGMVGKFIVKWLDVTFEVSPGKINHKDRKYILEHQEDFIGHKLEFVYQILSKYGIPRTASAIKVREDL